MLTSIMPHPATVASVFAVLYVPSSSEGTAIESKHRGTRESLVRQRSEALVAAS